MSDALVCPRCSSPHPLTERFCRDCRMPLTYASTETADVELTPRQEDARKIRPQFSEGELVKVAWGRNQAEGELIAGLLLEEGIPSLVRRAGGFDVPDMLAAGPRDVLVPASGVTAAREVLLEVDVAAPAGPAVGPDPVRLLVGVAVAVALVALIIWIGTLLVGV